MRVGLPQNRGSPTAPPPALSKDTTPAAPSLLRRSAMFSGLAGLAFAALFVTALVLIRQAPGLDVPDSTYAAFYSVGRGNVLVTAGLHIVPFAGIAFMWHMSATRTLIEGMPGAPSEMPRWLQLGSGIAFVCLLFTGTAAVGGVALLTVFSSAPLPPPDVARTLTSVGYGMVFVFGVRAAGMFIIATTTLLRSRLLLPRWLAVVSYLAAAFLLVSTTYHPAILLVLPGWVTAVSVALGAHGVRRASPLTAPAVHPHPRTSPDIPRRDSRRSRRHANPTPPPAPPAGDIS